MKDKLDIPVYVKDWLESNDIPEEFLDIWQVIEFGSQKYERGDWLTNPEAFKKDKRYASICRHAAKAYYSWKLDEESGIDHLLHLATNALMQYTVNKRKRR